MIVSALDKNSDWSFGRGRQNYITGGGAIAQKVKCRIRSFKNDNPLNMGDNIDWLYLMSEKNTEQETLREIERVTLATDGVMRIVELSMVVNKKTRHQSIELRIETVFDEQLITFPVSGAQKDGTTV
ncbi:TPA: hypothetical protein ACVU0F_000661 [Yersinia enterocolitica]|uniref:Bacteriophage protein n=1 Tax=Yersinia alsatica TaxID=2890317 RepID=A0ABY5UMD6_9GAMM|nr:hypothetical protein [Yersinia alsatica]OWF68969.1 hypothetical protein B4901_10365 [Yersinia frederiksenii]UWM44646.1 hypothetical protein N0H69_18625 [Yersinia alsatica]HEB0976105.1 hypothetical protein [Yersinia enterocolitica]